MRDAVWTRTRPGERVAAQRPQLPVAPRVRVWTRERLFSLLPALLLLAIPPGVADRAARFPLFRPFVALP